MGFSASCDWNDPQYDAGADEQGRLAKNDPKLCGEEGPEDSETSDDEGKAIYFQ